MKLFLVTTLICCAISSTAMAFDDNHDSEIQHLKRDVRILKKEVRRLQNIVENGDYNRRPQIHVGDGNKGQWGCYLDDVSAGGVYGTGRSEAEARGKALAACNKKGGACFDNQLKCSRAD